MNQRLSKALILAAVLPALLLAHAAFAQAGKNPFSVGAEQGGGDYSGIAGWILMQQNAFYLSLKAAVSAAAKNGSGGWTLAALSFAYGVFHAAGPGHGKAVVASYMLANEQALRRGLMISFLAALLQGAVAIALVSLAVLAFQATAPRMNAAAALIEELSYLGIVLLGLWLVWTKGRGFWQAWRRHPAAIAAPVSHGGHAHGHGDGDGSRLHAHGGQHHHDGPLHVHGEHCGHFHAPDPKTLGAGFSWRAALTTVVVAGARPCSGAILVLAFTLAQGVFWIGIWSVAAMSLGTFLTTGALAALAVLAKGAALRFSGADTSRARSWVAGLELAAAVAVVLAGAGLLAGATLHPGLG